MRLRLILGGVVLIVVSAFLLLSLRAIWDDLLWTQRQGYSIVPQVVAIGVFIVPSLVPAALGVLVIRRGFRRKV